MILCFYFLFFSKIIPSFFTIKEGFFLPLRLSCKESSTFLTKPLFPQEREDVTALLGARNRYAIRLADHQRSRHVVRDGTALLRCIPYLALSLIYMDQQKEKTSYIYYCLLINFAANSKKSATFLKLSNCWQYILA